jgi:sucrose-6-phosphate hydrolase SacC (GH32 family)
MQIHINGIEISYLSSANILSINDRKIKWPIKEGLFDARILVDRTCIEIFSADGLLYGTYACIQKNDELISSLNITEGEGSQIKGTIYSLKSCWQ